MTKRKRTDEEQKLYDRIETLKDKRREMVAKRDESLDALNRLARVDRLDDTLDASETRVAGLYLFRCGLVKKIDLEISVLKHEYDDLRAEGDKKP